MQESEAFNRELKARYAAIVAETLGRARHCLSLARAARRAGNRAERRKQLLATRVLWMAAAEWRKRAQRIAPALVCLLWLAGCATPNCPKAIRVTDAVSLPLELVRSACLEGTQDPMVIVDHVEVLYRDNDYWDRKTAWAIECYLFRFGVDELTRKLVDFRKSTAAVDRIRDYLVMNGVRVPLQNP